MEQLHRPLRQRTRPAGEPVAVWALTWISNSLTSRSSCASAIVAFMHEGDAEPLRRRLEHQRARIEMVDCERFEIAEPGGVAPGAEGIRHVAVDERGEPRNLLGADDRIGRSIRLRAPIT